MVRTAIRTAAEAEDVAVAALGWIAADQDVLGRFLAMSGAGLEDIRRQASDAGFLGFVLDFLLTDEALVTGFADAAGYPPEAPAKARARLPGGDLPAWT